MEQGGQEEQVEQGGQEKDIEVEEVLLYEWESFSPQCPQSREWAVENDSRTTRWKKYNQSRVTCQVSFIYTVFVLAILGKIGFLFTEECPTISITFY